MLHKLIYTLSVPLIDFDEFMIRLKEMPKMIMQTRYALKNDDWDQEYKDIFTISASSKLEKPQNLPNNANLINNTELAQKNIEKEFKEKRRKEHFFHGKIKFES